MINKEAIEKARREREFRRENGLPIRRRGNLRIVSDESAIQRKPIIIQQIIVKKYVFSIFSWFRID